MYCSGQKQKRWVLVSKLVDGFFGSPTISLISFVIIISFMRSHRALHRKSIINLYLRLLISFSYLEIMINIFQVLKQLRSWSIFFFLTLIQGQKPSCRYWWSMYSWKSCRDMVSHQFRLSKKRFTILKSLIYYNNNLNQCWEKWPYYRSYAIVQRFSSVSLWKILLNSLFF